MKLAEQEDRARRLQEGVRPTRIGRDKRTWDDALASLNM